jgi:hypothetical protein
MLHLGLGIAGRDQRLTERKIAHSVGGGEAIVAHLPLDRKKAALEAGVRPWGANPPARVSRLWRQSQRAVATKIKGELGRYCTVEQRGRVHPGEETGAPGGRACRRPAEAAEAAPPTATRGG